MRRNSSILAMVTADRLKAAIKKVFDVDIEGDDPRALYHWLITDASEFFAQIGEQLNERQKKRGFDPDCAEWEKEYLAASVILTAIKKLQGNDSLAALTEEEEKYLSKSNKYLGITKKLVHEHHNAISKVSGNSEFTLEALKEFKHKMADFWKEIGGKGVEATSSIERIARARKSSSPSTPVNAQIATGTAGILTATVLAKLAKGALQPRSNL